MTKNRLIAAVLGAAFLFGAGWVTQGWRADARIAQLEANHAAQVLDMAEAAKRIGEEANKVIAQADAKGVKEIKDAKAETERVRRCIAAGTCGVWIKSNQASAKPDLSGNASTGSLGNAATGLTQEAAGRVLDLWDAVDADAAKLGYLQEYARQCYRSGLEANKLMK